VRLRWSWPVNNLLIAIAVFVITVIGALFAVPYFVDWNSYRSNFEEEASRVVGREVQVDGDVKLYLLPTPYFRLEKVRIADASPDVTFFRADSLSLKLSIPPMFRGIVEANEIEFQRPFLRLALDAKGGWNWQRFAQALGSAGYMPASVTLTSLKITDGTLALHGPDGAERTRLEGLKGELSADALNGPYRFRGLFVAGGLEREIRLATAKPDADGTVRMRASLRLVNTGATYLLDARVADLMGQPRVEGELTARLPIAGFWQPLPSSSALRKSPGPEEEHKLDKNEAAFELKAAVKADAAGAQLSDLSLNFDQDGRPQIVTGSMQADWRSELTLDLTLTSRWLDLDRITGVSDDAGPIDGIAKFSARLRDLLPGQGKAKGTFTIDQANLGHDTVGPVRLALARTDEKLEIQELRIGLPGGSRGELQGSLSGSSQAVTFDGSLGLRGTSVARFLAWAGSGALPIDAKSDGPFGLRARLVVGGGKVAARDVVGNLSGTALSGTAHYRWEGRPEISIALEGPQIDARAFVPAGASFSDVFGFLLRGPETKAGGSRGQVDVLLRLSAGQLATAARVYRDVTAQMDLKGGQLANLQLRLSGDGFNLELQGNIDDIAGRPKGSLRGAAVASSAAGLGPLSELFGVPVALRLSDARSQAVVPLRLAGSMLFGGRTPTATDLIIDGEANGAAVKMNARFDGTAGGWRSGKADVTATAESADGGKIAALLLAGGNSSQTGSGRFLVKATGVPSEGLSTIASFEAGDVAFGFRGRVAATEAGIKTTGDLEFRAGDGTRLAALAGLSPPLKLDGMPINGRVKLGLGDGSISLEQLALSIAGSRLAGDIVLSRPGERRRIEAKLDADEVSLSKLLAPLLDQRMAIAGVAEAAISGRQAWPDEPFSAAVMDAFEGNIRLSCKRLIVADGIALDAAKLDVVLGGGKIEVDEISGSALGGEFKAKMQISKAAAGVDLRGGLKFTAALEALSVDGTPRASGQANGVLEFTGRGLSPRALMSALQGQGKTQFGEAKLATLWPGAIPLAADAGLKAEPDKLSAAVKQGLASALSNGSLSLAQKTFTLEIADGQLRAKAFAIDTAEGRASGTASVDLKALTFDSQWRLEAKAVAGTGMAAKQLPAVIVVYRGPLAALGTLDPRIDSAALEQELSARKIERDVEELERLRKMDEQRRMMESERLRKQFEQPNQQGAPPSGAPRPAAPG
jgi:uncharacterized protein involved in outer membrane biogenesis